MWLRKISAAFTRKLFFSWTLKKKAVSFRHVVCLSEYFCDDGESSCKGFLCLIIVKILHVHNMTSFIKVKQSHYRPGQAQRIPGGWGSQITWQSARESSKVVSPTHRPPLPSGNTPGSHFVRGGVNHRARVRPEGLCQWRIPVTTD